MMPSKHRIALYGKIEVGRKQLPGMGDKEFFADWLENTFGKRSRKDLSLPDLCRVVDMLAQLGAVFTAHTGKRFAPEGQPYKAKAAGRRTDFYEIPDTPLAPQKRKICKLWKLLGYDMTKIDTRVQREYGVEALRWCNDAAMLRRIILDLEKRYRSKKAKAEQARTEQATQ